MLSRCGMQRGDSQYTSLTANAVQSVGWKQQAVRLTVIHTIVGRAAMTVAEQVRKLTSSARATSYDTPNPGEESEFGLDTGKDELANELEQMRASLAEREASLIRAKQWIKYLAERGVELEQQVARQVDTPPIRKEDIEALAAQSAAADKQAVELEVELGSARQELVRQGHQNRSLQTSLNLIVTENSRLSLRLTESEAALDKAYDKCRSEINTLNTLLEATLSRAIAAEKMLVELRQSSLACTDEKGIEQLQKPPLIEYPAERVAQLETELDLVKTQRKLRELDLQLQWARKERTVPEATCENARANCPKLRCELDCDVRFTGEYSERTKVRCTEMLLANILTP
jgi:hypothetical protein